MRRLVAVSNRVTASKGGKVAGGLAVGVLSALRERGGVWFGWSGNTREQEASQAKVTRSGNVKYATVDIAEHDFELYYNGFSNNTLWPLFHSLLGFFAYRRSQYQAYCRVNEFFARRIMPLLEPDDLIWVHDYHLIPFANELRRAGMRQPIGFFLHVPWPAYDVLRVLPGHEQLLRDLSNYDVVGFQTQRDLSAFLYCITQPDIGGKLLNGNRVEAFGRRFVADVFPIGIDVQQCRDLAIANQDNAQVKRLATHLGDRQLMIGVDRLDYSKGLSNRFRAVESLLANYPDTRRQVIFLQIAPPTRAGVRAYDEIRHELEAASGNINGQYAEMDWAPIRYLNRGYDRGVVMTMLRLARVGLVTPVRDGMNLVAKEYIASQDPEDPGVLVLSQLAGAAEELSDAVLVNPYDRQGVADGIQTALTMDLSERRERHQRMIETLEKNDIHRWCNRFLDELTDAAG